MTNRVTWALQRGPDGWKIAHEHTSAPLGERPEGDPAALIHRSGDVDAATTTDAVGVNVILRYRLVLSIVLVAIAATAAFLTFGLRKPGQPNQRLVDLARVHYYSPAVVRTAFAAHGVRLRYESAPGVEPTWLSATPLPASEERVYVMLGPRTGSIQWGPKHPHVYDVPFGNLLVHDGGSNARTLAAVEAAVAALRDAGQ